MKLFKFATIIALTFASISTGQTVQQNIDNACVQVLGSPCSTGSQLNSTYENIKIQINNRKLASDTNSIVSSYLMPMVQSSVGWKMNLIDWAWPAAGCKGMVAESEWYSKFGGGSGHWQNYQQLLSLMRSIPGCTPVVAAPPVIVTQYMGSSAMQTGYQTVWGAAANYAAVQTNCPVAIGAVNCVRSQLAAYVSSHGTSVLGTLDAPVFAQVLGFAPETNALNGMAATFGRYWTGADDLRTYLTTTKSQWPRPVPAAPGVPPNPPAIPGLGLTRKSFPAGMQGAGFLSNNGSAVDLYWNEHLLVRDLSGNLISQDGGGLVAAGGGNYTDPATGLVLDASGKLIPITWKLVAAGGGNLVAAGGGNLGSTGIGYLVGNSGGTLVAAGGGNLVAAGGGNFTLYTTDSVIKALNTANVQAAPPRATAASIIGINGGKFIPPNVYSLKSFEPAAQPNSSGSCPNPDVTRAIQTIAGRSPSRTPARDECTFFEIRGIPYNDLLMNIGQRMGWPLKTCDDLSITLATLQVRNHLPTDSGVSGACDKVIYHWPWANYGALVTAVKTYGPQ